MPTDNYSLPVSQLLTHGDPFEVEDWSDYLNLGLTTEHIPALIEMALDEALYQSQEDPTYWAPIHAWRTLGQLQAEAAIDPLIRVLHRWGDKKSDWWEWVNEEMPPIFSLIGAASMTPLAAYAEDPAHSVFCTGTVVFSIEEIGKQHPESRGDCIKTLNKLLERFAQNPPDLNSYIVSSLADLQAVDPESLDVIERAFAADSVDEMFVGDWDDFQVSVGLKAPDPEKQRRLRQFEGWNRPEPEPSGFRDEGVIHSRISATKAKRKTQKESRRKNRRKKK
jgi:Protein of unknown function (DUF1186)